MVIVLRPLKLKQHLYFQYRFSQKVCVWFSKKTWAWYWLSCPSTCSNTCASTFVTIRASTCSNTRASMVLNGASMCSNTCASTCITTRASTCITTRASTCHYSRARLLFKNMPPGAQKGPILAQMSQISMAPFLWDIFCVRNIALWGVQSITTERPAHPALLQPIWNHPAWENKPHRPSWGFKRLK